ncbi:MAG: rod-binding protein [Alphaproteobacteria bacterium]
MIDAGIISGVMMKQIDRSADSTMRLAKAHAEGIQKTDGKSPDVKADKVSKDFESLFISQMLEQMFGESLGEDFFGSEESSDVYRQLMVEQYGKKISASGGIGIADYVKRELLKMQEV